MLQFLTDGTYDPESGAFTRRAGQPRCYYASDNVQCRRYRGLAARRSDRHRRAATACTSTAPRSEGVVFHLIGALSEFGKLGMVCVGATPARARELFRTTIAALDRAAGTAC